MHTIDLAKYPDCYNKSTNIIAMSEKGIPFATTYKVLNPKTGNTIEFEFSHSTGPEFDPKTIFVWKAKNPDNKPELEGLTLQLHNDAEITRLRAASYLKAKTRS